MKKTDNKPDPLHSRWTISTVDANLRGGTVSIMYSGGLIASDLDPKVARYLMDLRKKDLKSKHESLLNDSAY